MWCKNCGDVVSFKFFRNNLCLLVQVLNHLRDRALQGSTNRRALGLVNFIPALAYHFCLNLPATFTQPGARLLVEPCSSFVPNPLASPISEYRLALCPSRCQIA